MSPASLPEPPRVSWSPKAIRELQRIKNPSVREDLKRNAEEALHEIPEQGDDDREDHSDEYREDHSADEGRSGEIMWHRGWTHEQARQAAWEPQEPADDGPWNYFLLYRKVPGPTAFEVLAVRSIHQVANHWRQIKAEAEDGTEDEHGEGTEDEHGEGTD
jgi:hypothetical protein